MPLLPFQPRPTSPSLLAHPLLLVGLAIASLNSLHAVRPTALSSFDGLEEPSVRYEPTTDTFTPDSFPNIVDLGQGTFRMTLRYSDAIWDGDRNMSNRDRQRAEVKGLGPHQKHGETFVYRTTWRGSPGFRGSNRFCHLFQLKSTDGDSGAPLVTLSIADGHEQASVRYWPTGSGHSIVVREFGWSAETWQTVCIRVRTSPTLDGEVVVSVNGDPFVGVRDVVVARPDATNYRPKWGLYRGVQVGLPLGDDYVEHRDISAQRLPDTDEAAVEDMEQTAQRLASRSLSTALDWLRTQPIGQPRALATATVLARQAEADSARAVEVAHRLSHEEGRADAQLRVLLRWAEINPTEALAWLTRHTPDPFWDDPLWYWTTDTTLRYTQRDTALAGASLIADPDLRERAFEHIVMIWARREAAAAAQFVEETPALTPEQKAPLLRRLRR
jgi:hypothetical protein